jgi:CHAP domain
MATTAAMEKAVDLAEGQSGYDESACSSSVGNNTKFGVWYGMNCAAWCAMFVSWAYYQAGFPQPASTAKGFAYTPSGAAWYQSKGAWASAATNPERGWVVFFYSASAGRIAHVGLVRGPRGSDGLIPTVEGNTNGAGSAEGGSVLLKRRSPSQSLGFRIAGYGRPDLLAGASEEWYDMAVPEADQKAIAAEVKATLQPTFDRLALWIAGRANAVFSPQGIADRVSMTAVDFDTPAKHDEIDAIEASLKVLIEQTPTAAEIATLVVAALPDVQGGVTQEVIEAAFRKVLREIFDQLTENVPPATEP